MSERLTGDNLPPESFEDMRRDIMDLQASGVISAEEAADRLDSLQTNNPTVAGAHEHHIADNL